ncbi:MAG: hypothetical protein GYA55_05955, partial [SAR324 cluster bacterium]|nr:hypothetical protein [SAR324 cluster bacterium]
MKLSRRQFLKSGITAFGFAGLGICFIDNSFTLEMYSIRVPIEDLPNDFDGYRIGFLSDFHLGPFVLEEWIEDAVMRIVSQDVDLLVLGGDYQGIPDSTLSKPFGNYRNRKYEHLSQEDAAELIFSDLLKLLSLVRPKDGIVAVYGNHDRRSSPNVCSRIFSQRQDLFLLENDTHIIKRGSSQIEIVGVADYLSGFPKLPKFKFPNSSLLISHNPDFVSSILESSENRFGLALCGHTHGGQIKLPIFGALTYNINDLRFAEGLFRYGSSSVYTSRGIGMVELPFRINCP